MDRHIQQAVINIVMMKVGHNGRRSVLVHITTHDRITHAHVGAHTFPKPNGQHVDIRQL